MHTQWQVGDVIPALGYKSIHFSPYVNLTVSSFKQNKCYSYNTG